MKKGLKFLSVLMLILGIITLVVGVMDVVLLQSTGGGVMADALTALAVIVFVAGGLLGLRASNHPAKATGAIVFGLLALAAAVASAVMDSSIQNICACVVPLLYFICAISVKNRA